MSHTLFIKMCTWEFSSWKPSRKDSNSSAALSIRSAYSPMIQIIDALWIIKISVSKYLLKSGDVKQSHQIKRSKYFHDPKKQFHSYKTMFKRELNQFPRWDKNCFCFPLFYFYWRYLQNNKRNRKICWVSWKFGMYMYMRM